MATLQNPTPAPSHSPTPINSETSFLPVSPVFNPTAQKVAFDVVILSSDSVIFYVHSNVLQGASKDAFREFLSAPLSDLPQPRVICVPDTSVILNVILHIIYDMSCIPQSPSFETVVTAVNQMPLYGFHPKKHIIQSQPIYGHLLSFAPLFPHGLYTLASHFDIYDLAAAASSYLLSSSLSSISDEMAQRIGPVYLKRLMSLHSNRLHSLKNIILRPPRPHPPTKTCTLDQQKQLEDVWGNGLVNLAWDVTPDLSMHRLRAAFNFLPESLNCDDCQEALSNRLNEVLTHWALIHRTI